MTVHEYLGESSIVIDINCEQVMISLGVLMLRIRQFVNEYFYQLPHSRHVPKFHVPIFIYTQ